VFNEDEIFRIDHYLGKVRTAAAAPNSKSLRLTVMSGDAALQCMFAVRFCSSSP
jgi:hypothetical protein